MKLIKINTIAGASVETNRTSLGDSKERLPRPGD